MTTVNLIIFGIGNVGGTLIDQLVNFKEELKFQQQIDLKIPIICNSKHALFSKDLDTNWKQTFEQNRITYNIQDILRTVSSKELQNLIAVDATGNDDIIREYPNLVEQGFNIVAANKVANTVDFEFYRNLREILKQNQKKFYYETNVGAGLPVIETVKNLKQSGEKVQKIRGVFSGSLSYIFNRFSEEDIDFSEILIDATHKGYTEPDARDDLSGKDVARKLLILARELGLEKNLDEVTVQSLVPENLNGNSSLSNFTDNLNLLDPIFKSSKTNQSKNSVLRYVGELNVETQNLEVKLISEPKATPLGQLKGADNIFEIFTDSYHNSPLVIQGAGAGKEVTARGLFSDIMKITHQLN